MTLTSSRITFSAFQDLPDPVKAYMRQRASNYDGYNAVDLFRDLPEGIQDNPDAIMGYLKGVPELGVEPRHIMHSVSEANGGLDVPSNLQLGPQSINQSIGANDINVIDQQMIDASNADAVEVLLDPSNADILDSAIGLGSDTTMFAASASNVAEATDLAVTASEAGEAGLGELVGEALVDGLVPAIFAAKAGMYVASKQSTTEDKVGYGAAAAGGTVLLYANPITGPIAWTATGVYSGWKLFQLGRKLAPHVMRQVELQRAQKRGMWA